MLIIFYNVIVHILFTNAPVYVAEKTNFHILLARMWKRSFFCGSGSAKNLPLPHRLFDLNSNLAKKFCPFPNVD